MSLNEDLSSRANVRDLAREWLERGGQDPLALLGAGSSVAEPALSAAEGLPQDDISLSDLRKALSLRKDQVGDPADAAGHGDSDEPGHHHVRYCPPADRPVVETQPDDRARGHVGGRDREREP